jgi:peptidoglycan/LPS O-acetylase OafA/YrhL
VPALDGVRGVAILLVLYSHFTLPFDSTGWLDSFVIFTAGHAGIGVVLFFVLSGYLITGILMDARGSAGYFRNFYARRAVRIVPLYYAMVVLSLVVLPRVVPGIFGPIQPGPAVAGPKRFDSFLDVQGYFWLHLSNFFFAAQPGRFGDGLGMMNVSWSLAIEEQFYLVWPAVVALCRPRLLRRVCWALVAVSLGSRLVVAQSHEGSYMPVYVLTWCRMDALAIGAALAVTVRSREGLAGAVRWAKWGAIVAVPILVACAWGHWGVWRRLWDQVFAYTAEAIVCAGLVVWCLSTPIGARALSGRVLQFFGRYSYAAYFLHVPVSWVVRNYVFRFDQFPAIGGTHLVGLMIFYGLALAGTSAAALASWHLFEKHFLALKKYFPARACPAEAGKPRGRLVTTSG